MAGTRNTGSEKESEYEVLVSNTWQDPRTGEETRFEVGDDYTGGDPHYVDVNLGPICRRKPAPAADTSKEN